MANKKIKLGKVTLNHKGYNVRVMVVGGKYSGKYGIYAGKNKIDEVTGKQNAIPAIEEIIKKNENAKQK